jgi:hypothetical protein
LKTIQKKWNLAKRRTMQSFLARTNMGGNAKKFVYKQLEKEGAYILG